MKQYFSVCALFACATFQITSMNKELKTISMGKKLADQHGFRKAALYMIRWNSKHNDQDVERQFTEHVINRIAYYATPEVTNEIKTCLFKSLIPYRKLKHDEGSASRLKFLPNGTLMNLAPHEARLLSFLSSLTLYDPFTGKVEFFARNKASVSVVTISSDFRHIATGLWNGAVHVWDAETALCKAHLKNHEASINTMRFSDDGSWLATGDLSGEIHVWDMNAIINLDKMIQHPTIEQAQLFTLFAAKQSLNNNAINYLKKLHINVESHEE